MSYLDKQEALIPLVPESLKDKQEKISTFKVFSAPGDTTSTRYDFRMYHIDSTEGVSYLLEWIRQAHKLRIATGNIDVDHMEGFAEILAHNY